MPLVEKLITEILKPWRPGKFTTWIVAAVILILISAYFVWNSFPDEVKAHVLLGRESPAANHESLHREGTSQGTESVAPNQSDSKSSKPRFDPTKSRPASTEEDAIEKSLSPNVWRRRIEEAIDQGNYSLASKLSGHLPTDADIDSERLRIFNKALAEKQFTTAETIIGNLLDTSTRERAAQSLNLEKQKSH